MYEYFPVLKEFVKRQAEYLSGGQQQMLAIGRALMSRPKVMLLDEPSLGLSPKLVAEIGEIVQRLNKEQNVTMLLVEQNYAFARQLADHVYIIGKGRIRWQGAAAELEQTPEAARIWLGV